MRSNRHHNNIGFSASTFLGFLIIVFLLMSVYLVIKNFQNVRVCETRLASIYNAVSRYEMKQGVLPDLIFYPVNATRDARSLPVFLAGEGLSDDVSVCPSLPRVLRKTGQTYLWNDTLNGRHLGALEEPQWMLVEMSALSADVPPPHWGRYHVLMTDGEIRKLSRAEMKNMNIPQMNE